MRVQALSDTLLRFEPKGPMGFEDNTTFMVQSRDFDGVPIKKTKSVGGVTTLSVGPAATPQCEAAMAKLCTGHRQSSGTCLDCIGANEAALAAANCTKNTATSWCPGQLPTGQFIITIDQPETPPPPPPAPPGPAPMCTAHVGMDIRGGRRISSCAEGAPSCLPAGATQQSCCAACGKDKECKAWIFEPQKEGRQPAGACWLMAAGNSLFPHANRVSGGHLSGGPSGPKPTKIKVTVEITDQDYQGTTVLYEIDDLDSVSQDLNWPAPLQSGDKPQAYAIKDYPRFYTPPWGPTPIPEGVTVDPALKETNGYDFRNDQTGDTYLFVIGTTTDEWHASRTEFVKLTGPTPVLRECSSRRLALSLLPTLTVDRCCEQRIGPSGRGSPGGRRTRRSRPRARSCVGRQTSSRSTVSAAGPFASSSGEKPQRGGCAVWALDMNWRNSKTAHGDDFIPCRNTGLPGPDDNCTSQDHYYDFPDCTRFPDFCGAGTGWFDWLKGQGLRTYFNDHPFPTNNGTAMQTSPAEVAFRHEGLTKWLANGLT